MPFPAHKTSSFMRLALAGSAILAVGGLAAFWYASDIARKAPAKAADNNVTVTIRDRQCHPNDITIPAGRTTFMIVNESDRALEWEILDGVMVVEERENIAPGFSQTMTVKLQPGTFDITCGLLSSPRGKLTVTPSAASEAEDAKPSLVNYIGALAEYRVFLALEAADLEEAAAALAQSVQRGDLPQARLDYARAHRIYKRIEPMGELFADLDTRLNARADYFEKREADPAFSGFHRIEYALFNPQQDARAALPGILTLLQQDITSLQERLHALQIPPERLAASASRLLRRIADNLPTGAEDKFSGSEAENLQGTLEGTRRIAELLSPLLIKAAPTLQQEVDNRLAAFEQALAPYQQAGIFTPRVLDEQQRKALAAPALSLSDAMGQINAALGLD